MLIKLFYVHHSVAKKKRVNVSPVNAEIFNEEVERATVVDGFFTW